MTPDEAATALRDDPTFLLMSRLEQEEEAGLILKTDDPLEIAMAVEAALAIPVAKAAAALESPFLEPCGQADDDNPAGCGGREPIAANGRCMSCGRRRALEAVEALDVPDEPAEPQEPETRSAVTTAHAEGDLVARFKAATGLGDAAIGRLIGKSRVTVQAYASGTLPEKLNGAARLTLAAAVEARLGMLRDLRNALD